jgi:hypothetical protein
MKSSMTADEIKQLHVALDGPQLIAGDRVFDIQAVLEPADPQA